MNKSILIELLGKFNHKEIREFGEYVRSPFFNKNEGVYKLSEYLRKQHPYFDEKCIGKEYIYSKIFPNVKYNDGFMRTLMFKLTELAESYLAFTKYRENKFTEDKYLLIGLNEKELDKHIQKKMKQILKEFDSIDVLDADYFINKSMIEWEYLYYLTRSNLDKLEKLVNRKDAEEIFNNLTYFYLFYTIKHYLYVIIIRNEYSIQFKTGLIENILKFLDPDEFKDVPVLTLYYNVLMLFLKDDGELSYYDVIAQINSLNKKLNKPGLRNIYTYILYFCRSMIRKGKSDFVNELFEIYKVVIEKKLYALQNEMSSSFYKGAVDTALKLKELDWALDFIERYKNELPPDVQENTYYYCRALYEFALKNYEVSLELLKKVHYTEVYQKLDLRCLISELYYELNIDDLLLSHLDSFRHFLSNDKYVPNERKKHYSNFIKYVLYLSDLKDKEKKQDLKYLKQKVEKDTAIYNKEWVIEKIDELKA